MNSAFAFGILARTALVALVVTMAPFIAWSRSYAPHEGYLATTAGERDAQVSEMVVIQPPKDDGPTLRERIFNDKLSKEFKDRYEEKFGRTEAQRVYLSPNKFTYYDDLYGFRGTPQQVSAERQKFGEFMVRRLMEWHVDNYAKSDPKVRPVWEAKERFSKVQIEVSKFRLDVAYQLSGNYADFNLVNPWFGSKVTVQMDSAYLGPGPVEETIVSVNKNLTPTASIETHFALIDGVVSFIGRKTLAANFGGALSVSTFTKEHGRSRRESLYLSSFSYSF